MEKYFLKSQCEVSKKFNGTCSYSWDSLLCWPETIVDTLAELPCFAELNGIKYDTKRNATRYCKSNGVWDNYTNYSACEHLNITEYNYDAEIITTIYFIGYSISLLSLSIAIWIFLYFKELKCLRNRIHLNLFWSYILANSIWCLTLIIQILLDTSFFPCVILMILLHYFHLTTFFWMFIEGFYLYMLVMRTFASEIFKIQYYIVIGWGTPLIIIITWIIIKNPVSDKRFLHNEMQNNLENQYWPHCQWMKPNIYDLIYQIPVMIILLINLVFLTIIMWVLIVKLQSTNNLETQQYKKATKALLILIPLLGISYILVLYGPHDEHNAWKFFFENIRAILLSLQGFIVVIFYCFFNTEVQNTVKKHFKTWKALNALRKTQNLNKKEHTSKSRTESFRLTEHPLLNINDT